MRSVCTWLSPLPLLFSFLMENNTEPATGTGNGDHNFLISRWNSLCHIDGLQNVSWSRKLRNGNLWKQLLKLFEDVPKQLKGCLYLAWEGKQNLQGRMKHPDPGPYPECCVCAAKKGTQLHSIQEGPFWDLQKSAPQIHPVLSRKYPQRTPELSSWGLPW